MKKSDKNSRKSDNMIVLLLTIIFLLIVWGAIKSSEVVKIRHLTECVKRCYPLEVDQEASRFNCSCQENGE